MPWTGSVSIFMYLALKMQTAIRHSYSPDTPLSPSVKIEIRWDAGSNPFDWLIIIKGLTAVKLKDRRIKAYSI